MCEENDESKLKRGVYPDKSSFNYIIHELGYQKLVTTFPNNKAS